MIVITSTVLITLISLMLLRMKFGKALRALANDPELARLNGINSDRYIMYAFAIGSFLAAVASIMISFDTDMTPTMGFNALVKGVIPVIIGGMGSLPGAALGGLFLGLTENLGVYWLPSQSQDADSVCDPDWIFVIQALRYSGQAASEGASLRRSKWNTSYTS